MPRANRLSDPVRVDHIPALIDELLHRLEALSAVRESEPTGPASGAVALGVLHGNQRASARYSVSEAMSELAHFRAALLELCPEQGVLVTAQDAELFHMTLDAMMTTSAKELDHASLVLYQRAMAFVAHELRNPLSAILMGSARLRSGAQETSTRALDVLARMPP